MANYLFLDESYRAKVDGPPPHYYIVATVFSSEYSRQGFENLLAKTGGLPFHTTDEARSLGGRLRLLEYIDYIRESDVACKVFLDEIGLSDKLGEQARVGLLGQVMASLALYSTDDLAVIYDKRMPGFQSNADERTFTALRQSGTIPRSLSVRAASAQNDAGLVMADIAAWSFRQHHIGNTSMYWNLLIK